MKQKTIQYLIGFYLLVFAVFAVNGQELKLEILNGHSGGVLSVAVSADGKFALTGSSDWTALLWDLGSGKQLRRFEGHELPVTTVSLSKDGQFVLTASMDKTARLWRTATGEKVQLFAGHAGGILSAAISLDGNLVATASEDKTARIWDAKTGKQLFSIEHAGKVNSIAFSPDSRLLLTGGEDKIARLYRAGSGELVRQFVGHTGEITSVAYSPDGKQVLTGSLDKTARLWSLETNFEVRRFETISEVLTVTFAWNGDKIIVSSETSSKGTIHLYDIFGKEVKKIDVFGLDEALATTPNEQLLYSTDSLVNVFSIAENKKLKPLQKYSGTVYDVAVSPDLRRILTSDEARTFSLWNITTGKFQAISELIRQKRRYFGSVAFSPDGSKFAYIADDFNIRICDTLEPFRVLQRFIHKGQVTSIAFSPDGNFVLTGSTNAPYIWQVEKELKENRLSSIPLVDLYVKGEPSIILNTAFSPDGESYAVTGQTVPESSYFVNLYNNETDKIKLTIKDW